MVGGGIWQMAKILPYKHAIEAYGAAITGLPSQVTFGVGVKKCHVVVLWHQHCIEESEGSGLHYF